MIDALVSGKLHGVPQQRISKTGRAFVTAKLRVPTGEDATFCNVVCFEPDTQAALLALGTGEAVALAGELRVSTWTDKSGTAHPSLDLVASRSLTQYHLTKRRRTMQPDQDGEQQRQQDRPSHDAGGQQRQQEGSRTGATTSALILANWTTAHRWTF